MRFKPGQEVVCTIPKDHEWINLMNPSDKHGPLNGEIVTICGYEGDEYVLLKEYSKSVTDGYYEMDFEPVVPQSEIESLMSSIPQTV